ncbi:MAG: VCBS repeat-containing protein [Planctomycetales bacterium]|nr:VCBS repeat-containing protein [Planctomycetales bacterium]
MHHDRPARALRHGILWAIIALAVATGCAKEDSARQPNASKKAAVKAADEKVLSAAEIVAVRNRAVGLMGQFKYRDAVPLFEQLQRAQSDSAGARVDLAIALLNRREGNDLRRSAELLAQAIDADQDDLRAHYCRALLLFHEGHSEKARQEFSLVAQRDPTDGYAAYYVGQCLFADGKFDEAIREFRQASKIDPYLRSAYYGMFQAAQRTGDQETARDSFSQFQRMTDNPRARLAELKYTRMGPKAEVAADDAAASAPRERPPGDIFLAAVELPGAESASPAATSGAPTAAPNVTVVDLDGDGDGDIFAAGVVAGEAGHDSVNTVVLNEGGQYRVAVDHPLATVDNVNTALWGDYDGDGLTDAYLCRQGANQLWRQQGPNNWIDVTSATQTAGGDFNTVDGACYDADHDGDLDYFLVNADGPNELLNNDRDGGFRSLAGELGIAGENKASRRVVVADLDSDDDADLLVLNETAPHEVFLNDRLWQYRAGEQQFEALRQAPLRAVVAIDADVDGQAELYAIEGEELAKWAPDRSGKWVRQRLVQLNEIDTDGIVALALADCDGDSQLDAIVHRGGEISVYSLEGDLLQHLAADRAVSPVALLVGDRGPELIASGVQTLMLWRAGPGRFPFALVTLTGRTDKGADMRSNASGIGVEAAARIGTLWATIAPFRADSGPGQSWQPAAIGLGGASKIDFLRLVWPDGVSQSELDLKPHTLHKIPETQRQAGSCPLVFVWNGERFEFVADVLGAGGIGFNLGKGEYYPPRPDENLLLPAEMLQPRDGRLVVKLGEPMEEICYFDAVRLVGYDLPAGWQMALDERFGASEPLPTGKPIFYRRELLPARAQNDRGEDVTAQIQVADLDAAPLHRRDRRFVGLADAHAVIFEFNEPLDELAAPVLVFDGWVEYAYSQTAFAAWQAGASFVEPTLEARDADGQWHAVAERFGYMAGTARRSAMPLDRDRLPPGATALRISTNLPIFWDRLAVVDAEPCPNARRTELPPAVADAADVGFSQRTFLAEGCAAYDYDDRPPLADARHPGGWYSAFGDVRELVAATDDAVAIIGPGEELHLEFREPEPPPSGFQRVFVLETNGWCKDADLFTQGGGAVEPLPTRGVPLTSAEQKRRDELHRRYNSRYKSGW